MLRAEAAGYRAIVLTVDLVALGRRERDVRTGFRLKPSIELPNLHRVDEESGSLDLTTMMLEQELSWADVERLRSWTSLPVLIKGILHPRDAELAVEHGCAGVIVSNHGGRQLDGAIAPIDALPRIAERPPAVSSSTSTRACGGVSTWWRPWRWVRGPCWSAVRRCTAWSRAARPASAPCSRRSAPSSRTRCTCVVLRRWPTCRAT